MKSRIIPSIPETVMAYNIGGRSEILAATVKSLGMTYSEIQNDKAGEAIGFLAGYNGFSSNGSTASSDGECVIFSGIDSKRLDMLLKAMHTAGLKIPLKAIVTAHNQSQSVQWLIEELTKEHEAMMKARGE